MTKIDKNNILNGASVLLVATVMILSTFGATANTMKETPEICVSLTEHSEANAHIKSSESSSTNTRGLLWDNGPVDERNALSCVNWPSNPLDRQIVDDFDVEGNWNISGGYFTLVTYDAHTQEFVDGMNVYFYEDVGNTPSMTSYVEILGVSYISTDTGNTYFDRPEISIEVIFDEVVTLFEGKWWVCFQPVMNDNSFWLTSAGSGENVWLDYPDDPNAPRWTPGFDIFGDNFDVNFKLFDDIETDPDLDCDGTLSWTDVTPESTITGTFTVKNIGEPRSLLDWEIDSYPNWGTWSFDPDGGIYLTPEAGEITVEVEVVAPADQNTEFDGEIVLVNSDDPADTCTIDVTLATPVSQLLILQFLELFTQRFPIIAQILAAIL